MGRGGWLDIVFTIFSLSCPRCSDVTEFGTNISALKCSSCREGLVLPETCRLGNIAFIITVVIKMSQIIFCFADSPWSCRFCTNPYDFALVSQSIDRIEEELYSIIDSNTNTAQLLLKFVSKYSDKLHSKHYLNLLGKT